MTNKEEQNYLDLLKEILDSGEDRDDRTGVGTKSLFGRSLRFDLSNNKMPLFTTKKIFVKGVIEELLFFLRGETQTKILEEKGVKIWSGNTSREFLDKNNLHYLPEGDMGKGYGFQWRNFGEQDDVSAEGTFYSGKDQIADVLKSLKENPTSRRHLVSAWNPQQLNQMVLPPCHYSFQFYVSNKKELSCIFNMRSTDTFLGLPFNVASYAFLTHIFAKTLGYTAKEVIFNGGDVHIYNNHVYAVKEQLKRNPLPFPSLNIKKQLSSIQDIEKLCLEDFDILDYKHHKAINASMAV